MILRVLNLVVICALILAAAYVYRIKFDSAAQAEKLAKLRSEVRHERDQIASLRAEWGQLDNPARIETLAKRYLRLQPTAPTQFDSLDHLPDRPAPPPDQENADAGIGGIIQDLQDPASTGSIPGPAPSETPAPKAAPQPAGGAPHQPSGAPHL